jgi:hypothetical protein
MFVRHDIRYVVLLKEVRDLQQRVAFVESLLGMNAGGMVDIASSQ